MGTTCNLRRGLTIQVSISKRGVLGTASGEASQAVSIPLEDLPEELYVFVIDEATGVVLDWAQVHPYSLSQPSQIETELPSDTARDDNAVTENQTTELKGAARRGNQNDVIETMVRFFNAEGGRIYVGIDDDKEVLGVYDEARTRSRIESWAHDCISPPVEAETGRVVLDGERVVAVDIPEGSNKPYRLLVDEAFFIRVGEDEERMTRPQMDEIYRRPANPRRSRHIGFRGAQVSPRQPNINVRFPLSSLPDTVASQDREESWKRTTLWKKLGEADDPHQADVRGFAEQWLRRVEKVLSKGSTEGLDFTLHDEEHSSRVSERMVDLIDDDVLEELCSVEIGLLLLSAYLHDIGMTPERSKISAIKEYLRTGDADVIPERERGELHDWLGRRRPDVSIPVGDDLRGPGSQRDLELLVAHYCRHQHVEWTDEWIEDQAERDVNRPYETWIQDIRKLCRSHHEGYKELVTADFDPKIVGGSSDVVHLRYLALVLRVADILEIDPERTPDVIFQHRDVHQESVTHWRKPANMSWGRDGDRIIVSAEPTDARLHRAVEETIDAVEDELRLADRLDREGKLSEEPVHHGPSRYRWTLSPKVVEQIQEQGYEYIKSEFRPDPEKILELFSGPNLYNNEMAAVRELVQNAFDAIRERLARERLAKGETKANQLREVHEVRVSVEEDEGDTWIVCRDDGAGMSKKIIENHLLRSGVSRRDDLIELERRCEEEGFELRRTGTFGIGVLSYFMIADRMEIETRRVPAAPDADGTGWFFETEGVDAWGELRREAKPSPGTEVRLRLNDQALDTEEEWSEKIRRFAKRVIHRTPCKLSIQKGPDDVLSFGPGWVSDDNRRFQLDPEGWMPNSVTRLEEDLDHGLATEKIRATRARVLEAMSQLDQGMANAVSWRTEEGEFDDGLGSYRAHTARFDLPAGESHFYFELDNDGRLKELAEDERMIWPAQERSLSWKGIQTSSGGASWPLVGLGFGRARYGIQEVDLTSDAAGDLAVSRAWVEPAEETQEAVRRLDDVAKESLVEDLRDHPRSPPMWLTSALLDGEEMPEADLHWFHATYPEGEPVWAPVEFPFTLSGYVDDHSWDEGSTANRSFPVGLLESVKTVVGPTSDRRRTISPAAIVSPNEIVIVTGGNQTYATLMWGSLEGHPVRLLDDPVLDFPDAWAHIVGFEVAGQGQEPNAFVWNTDNPLVEGALRASSNSDFLGDLRDRVRTDTVTGPDPSWHLEELLDDDDKLALWLCLAHRESGRRFWDTIRDEQRDLLLRSLDIYGHKTATEGKGSAICTLTYNKGSPRNGIERISSEGRSRSASTHVGAPVLPEPGSWMSIDV